MAPSLQWVVHLACYCAPHLFLEALTGVEGHIPGNPHRQPTHNAGSGSPKAV